MIPAMCKAQTTVSGFISANTNWNAAGSPYIVTGNALLSHGFTLTIDPGVIVKFDHGKALQIDGKLIAIGTPQQHIKFTSNQATPVAGDWAKIHFSDTCEDGVFNSLGNYLSGTIMKYCDVEYGGEIGYGEIHIESSNPYFSHCNITNSGSSGIYVGKSVSRIDSSNVSGCTDAGLYFAELVLQSDSLIIQNNTLDSNSVGIEFAHVVGAPSPVIIRNNSFNDNLLKGGIYVGFTPFQMLVEGNNFSNNTSNMFGIFTAGVGSRGAILRCNTFINNTSRSGAISFEISFHSYGSVYGNTFENNSSPGLNGVSVFTSDSRLSSSPTYFNNNSVINNTSVNGKCCRIYARTDQIQFMQINNNDFIGNNSLNTIYMGGSGTSGQNDYLLFKNNTLSNPLSLYEFYNDIPYGLANADLDSNYWGNTNTQHIDSAIYDYFDFANQSVVYYSPILSVAPYNNLECSGILSSIEGIDLLQHEFLAFPNPVRDILTLQFKNKTGKMLMLVNMLGEIVLSQNLNSSPIKTISLRQLPDGIYSLIIFMQDEAMIKKLIIKEGLN